MPSCYVSAHKLIDIQRFSAREGGAPRRPEIMGLAALAPPEKCRWNVELFMRGYIDGGRIEHNSRAGY